MLDVHPPHAPTHTWRDFFIHIATIVVGLLIAIGLEQTVEYVHHRHQIAETREALRAEREENYKRFASYVRKFQLESQRLQQNMRVLLFLEQHPGVSRQYLPGTLEWHMSRNQFATSAWHTAQTSGVLTLMPKDEVLADETVYGALQDISNLDEEEWLVLNDATRFQFTDPDPLHLTPIQITEELGLMQKLMMKHYLRGNFMQYPQQLDSAFIPGPTDEYMDAFHKIATSASGTAPSAPATSAH